MTPRRLAKLAVGLGFSLGFAYLAARDLDLQAFRGALAEASPAWILLATICFACGYACRVQRWRLMLASSRPGIGFWRSAVPLLASVATNNVLPFRAGDALRAIAFSRWLGIGTSRVLATLLVERLLDLLSLLAFAALLLTLLAQDLAGAWAILGIGGHVFAGIALVVLVALFRPRLFFDPAHLVVRIIRRFATGIGDRLDLIVMQIFDTLEHQARGAHMFRLMIWSAMAWTLEGGIFYATARALPSITEMAGAILAFPVATLATLLPSTPGYVGTFDFFAIRMAELAGNPPAAAAAFAVLVHMILWLAATLAGGICLLIWIVLGDGGSRSNVATSVQ
jgi:uncharacterized protein (TIRG00374 family)